jgi:two-component system LytT family response regulator
VAVPGEFDGAEADRLVPTAPSRLAVRSVGRIRFVRTTEIDWIEATDYYSKLHLGDRSFLVRESMTSLEGKLAPRHFVRIHRSSIVNVERVREIRTRHSGGHTVILHDGTRLRLSRSRRGALRSLLPR